MTGNVVLLALTLLPMAGAIISYICGRYSKRVRNIAVCAVTAAEFALMLYSAYLYGESGEFSFILEDFCVRGLVFKLDGFRLIYGFVAALMWLMAALFSIQYFSHYRNRNRYYFFLLLTQGSTMGVFMSADLYTTFIFFEIMSFTSYAWVAHDERAESLRAAQTYMAVAVISGLVMLMGLFMLNDYAGTLRIDMLYGAVRSAAAAGVRSRAWLYTAGAFLLFGFGAKAGMFPLHIWLPKAHPAAPAPASALLSGILTKCGIFGIIVISCDIFRFDGAWGNVILLFGIITMFAGALLALFSVDLKRTLACSSVSQIGFILTGIGMQCLLGAGNATAARGTLLHMVNHSLIKLVLFMAAGAVYMNTHKLNLNDIRGYGRKHNVLKAVFLIGGLSVGGVPLFSGYISKTLLHESISEYAHQLESYGQSAFLYNAAEWIFLLTGGMTIAYMLKLYVSIFVEKGKFEEREACMDKLSGSALVIPAAALLVMGIMPGVVMDRIGALGQGFMSSAGFEGAAYFSLTNLKGAAISIIIGVFLYVVLVRRCLCVKGRDGLTVYVDRWPSWLDLEERVYRPLLEKLLPCVFGAVCGLLQPDRAEELIRNTVYKPLPIDKKPGFRKRLYKKYVGYESTAKIIMASMAFGMLMLCIGLCFTLIYLLSLLI